MPHLSTLRSSSKPSSLRPIIMAVALAFGALPLVSHSESAPFASSDGTLLTISAQGAVTRAPDIATLSTGMVTQAVDANTAMRANAEQMTKVVAAIKGAGIAERDVQTSGVSLHPQYKYSDNQPPTITGYQASNTVTITVRDIAKLGSILDALVANGANQINGPSFDLDTAKKDAAYDDTRRAAIGKAQARAEMYAKTLGVNVRRIVTISEGGGFALPQPVPMMEMSFAKASADTPIAPGENTISVNLDVVFELGK